MPRSAPGTGHPGLAPGGTGPGPGRSSGGGTKGSGGGYGLLGYKADGPGPRSTAGGGISPSKGSRGEGLVSGKGLKGSGRRSLSVFEKASMGLPLDEDELQELSPEMRAMWESQRASILFGG